MEGQDRGLLRNHPQGSLVPYQGHAASSQPGPSHRPTYLTWSPEHIAGMAIVPPRGTEQRARQGVVTAGLPVALAERDPTQGRLQSASLRPPAPPGSLSPGRPLS